MAILCVGVAYFVIGVLLPAAYLFADRASRVAGRARTTGLVFSGLAGVAGAVGAICVIFATKAAVDAASEAGLPPATYKVYIAPLIFGLAPVINTLVSIVWHPKTGQPFHFGFDLPRLEAVGRHRAGRPRGGPGAVLQGGGRGGQEVGGQADPGCHAEHNRRRLRVSASHLNPAGGRRMVQRIRGRPDQNRRIHSRTAYSSRTRVATRSSRPSRERFIGIPGGPEAALEGLRAGGQVHEEIEHGTAGEVVRLSVGGRR